MQLEQLENKRLGKGMTYKEVLNLFQSYNKENHLRYSRNIVFKRYPHFVSMDFYMSKQLIVWYPSGRIKVNFKSYTPYQQEDIPREMLSGSSHFIPWSDRQTVQRFLPWNWQFSSCRYHAMIHRGEEEPRECPAALVFLGNGELSLETKDKLGKTKTEIAAYYKKHDIIRDKPRRRGRYWQARARNLYRDKKNCKAKKWWDCEWRRDRVNRSRQVTRPGELSCGCRIYRKDHKFRYTVQQILKEPNATVRTCMIKMFGVDKFFTKVTAKTLSRRGDYTLLQIHTGNPNPGMSLENVSETQIITALRMKCPSTGQVYVNLVPNTMQTVSAALDWMFNYRNFTINVGQQT
jgi:hypothetical protein